MGEEEQHKTSKNNKRGATTTQGNTRQVVATKGK